jgi:fucose permease
MGIVADKVSVLPAAEKLSLSMGVSAEQIGLKAGMLVTAIFPILGTVIVIVAARYFRKRGFV